MVAHNLASNLFDARAQFGLLAFCSVKVAMRQGSYLNEYARKPELIVQEPPCCRQVRL